MNRHRFIENRSRALHLLMVRKMRYDRAFFIKALDIAKGKLCLMKSQKTLHPMYVEYWQRILESANMNDVFRGMLRGDETGRMMRQVSPFVGILTQEERQSVFDRYSKRWKKINSRICSELSTRKRVKDSL